MYGFPGVGFSDDGCHDTPEGSKIGLPEDSWRDLYCEYVGIDRTVMEHIMLTAVGDLHFILHDIEKPTPEELQEIIAWVESRVNNSEELET